MSEKNKTNSKYRKEYAGMLQQFIEECLANEKKPTLFEFMRRVDVYDRHTISRWAAEHAEFSRVYEMYMEASRSMIVEKALTGDFDASFSKFLLSCDYGMKEKTQVDIGGAENNAFQVNITVVD